MKAIFIFIMVLGLIPVAVSAQKAYDAAHYHSKIGNRAFKLELGMGYFAASTIKQQTGSAGSVIFYPDTAVPDDKYQVTFHAKGRPDYFVLDDMQESFDSAPPVVEGRYWFGKKWLAVKFVLGR